jgi:hypothetical protein
MQPELKRRIEAAAKANGRSLNAEIAARLEWSLQEDGKRTGGLKFIATAKRIAATGDHEERLARLEAAMRELNPAFGTNNR